MSRTCPLPNWSVPSDGGASGGSTNSKGSWWRPVGATEPVQTFARCRRTRCVALAQWWCVFRFFPDPECVVQWTRVCVVHVNSTSSDRIVARRISAETKPRISSPAWYSVLSRATSIVASFARRSKPGGADARPPREKRAPIRSRGAAQE